MAITKEQKSHKLTLLPTFPNLFNYTANFNYSYDSQYLYKASATLCSDIRLQLVPRLGLSGFIPPFPHLPSWHAQRDLCCTFTLLPFTFSHKTKLNWNHFARTRLQGHTALSRLMFCTTCYLSGWYRRFAGTCWFLLPARRYQCDSLRKYWPGNNTIATPGTVMHFRQPFKEQPESYLKTQSVPRSKHSPSLL